MVCVCFHTLVCMWVCLCVCVHTHVWQDAAGLARPALCHRNSSKWGGGMSLPPLLLPFADPVSDALLSTHQPQALHFNTDPQGKARPASAQLPFGRTVLASSADCRKSKLLLVQAVNVYWITLCFSKQKEECSITIEKGLRLVSPPALLLRSTLNTSLFPRMWNSSSSSSSSAWTLFQFLQVLH